MNLLALSKPLDQMTVNELLELNREMKQLLVHIAERILRMENPPPLGVQVADTASTSEKIGG